MPDYPRKLIEVALPLDAINKASAREKGVRGHPNTLHQWWARRPLAACRSVIFASLVDDPGEYLPGDTANKERERLFRLMGRLAEWSGAIDKYAIRDAHLEIARSVARGADLPEPRTEVDVRYILANFAPPVYDPFSGSGSIPIEAQRLGLRSLASDLNPVAVLMTRAATDLPVRFGNRPPVNPHDRSNTLATTAWCGTGGLAADIRHYAGWMRTEAERRLGRLYPRGPTGENIIAWIWARTVECPNPVCGARMPLVRSFWLCSKPGKQTWIEPVVNIVEKSVRFEVKSGHGAPSQGTVNRHGAWCLVCGPQQPIKLDYVRAEGRAGRIGHELLAIVAEAGRGRIYLSPTEDQRATALIAEPDDVPATEIPQQALGFRVQIYGMTRFCDLFTPRQLTALKAFSDLVGQARSQIEG